MLSLWTACDASSTSSVPPASILAKCHNILVGSTNMPNMLIVLRKSSRNNMQYISRKNICHKLSEHPAFDESMLP